MWNNLFKNKKEKEITSKTQSIHTENQILITRDNQTCMVSFLISYDVVNYKVYTRKNHNSQAGIETLVIVGARNVLGEYDLEQIKKDEKEMGEEIRKSIEAGGYAFGVNIVDIMITQVNTR